jgi:phosphonoacetaldehyde hydrolase
MMEQLLPQAAREGYAPDCLVTPDQVGGGRPAPWMIFENMKRLGVYPPEVCVKVGDTASDMLEGRNAGMTSIGVCESSNEAVLHGAKGARALLTVAGAHAVIGTVAELWEELS